MQFVGQWQVAMAIRISSGCEWTCEWVQRYHYAYGCLMGITETVATLRMRNIVTLWCCALDSYIFEIAYMYQFKLSVSTSSTSSLIV